jgi:hypothetical protein
VGAEELGDGARIAGQEFAIGPSIHAVVGLLDDLFGGHTLLT